LDSYEFIVITNKGYLHKINLSRMPVKDFHRVDQSHLYRPNFEKPNFESISQREKKKITSS